MYIIHHHHQKLNENVNALLDMLCNKESYIACIQMLSRSRFLVFERKRWMGVASVTRTAHLASLSVTILICAFTSIGYA